MGHPSLNAIVSAQSRFEEIALANQRLTFREEAGFAKRAIMASITDDQKKSRFALFNCEPASIEAAIVQVASIGLTLNPAHKYAYLVPRYNKQRRVTECCLDVSYQGLVQLAIESGIVTHVVAERVFQDDIDSESFQYRGPLETPVHHGNPFATNRGDSVGVYCVATLTNGAVITTHMTKAELDKIASLSFGRVWVDFRGEMEKKACIKRAFKSWPKPRNDDRLAKAVEHLNTIEGLDPEKVPGIQQSNAALPHNEVTALEPPKHRPLTAMERMIQEAKEKAL